MQKNDDATRLSVRAFFGHKSRDRSGPFLVFCRLFCMAIGQHISKVQAQESSGRLSNFNMVEYCGNF